MKQITRVIRPFVPVMSLVFVTLIVTLFYNAYAYVSSTIIEQNQKQLLLLADTAARGVDSFFQAHAQALRVLARNPAIVEAAGHPQQLKASQDASRLLNDLVAVHGDEIRSIELLDARGQRLYLSPSLHLTEPQWAGDAAALAQALSQQRPLIHPPQSQHGQHWYAEVLTPVFDQQQFVGVLRELLDFNYVIQHFIQPLKPFQRGYAWIMNDRGLLLWHPEPALISEPTAAGPMLAAAKHPQLTRLLAAIREGTSGTGMYDLPARQANSSLLADNVVGYAPVESMNRQLSIAVNTEYAAFSEPIDSLARHAILLTLLMLLVLTAGGRLFARHQAAGQRLAGFFGLLSTINQAIARHQGHQQLLLQEIYCSSHRNDLLPLTYISMVNDNNALQAITGNCDAAVTTPAFETLAQVESLSAQVVREGRYRIVNHRCWTSKSQPPVRTLAAFPIRKRDAVVGALVVGSKYRHSFQAAETRVLNKLAEDVGLALQSLENEQRRNLAERIFENILEAAVITDAEQRILWVNSAFTRITGYSAEECLGQTPRLLRSGRHGPAFYRQLWTSLTDSGRWRGEIWNRCKNGDEYPEWLTISTVCDEQQRVSHYVAVFADLREHKQLQQHIHRLANYDPLTGLPNRLLLRDSLKQTLSKQGHCPLAVLALNLDRFKHINESLGQQGGDQVLRQVAARLQDYGQFLARENGDEFVLLLTQPEQAAQAQTIAQQVIQRLAEPIALMEHQFNLSASIGISIYPQDGIDADSLLQRAEAAVHHAQSVGGGHRFYTEGLNERALRRLTLESALRQAVKCNQLRLLYQPQVDLDSGRVVGVEALVRWQHPQLGLVSPAEFIPLAEETGLIIAIGEWVFRTACAQAQAWREQGLEPLRIGVNLSARQFLQPDLASTVTQVLSDSGLDARYLELEITESLLMDNIEQTVTTLNSLKSLGVHLAIDDFATGYSSLSYLKRFPLDRLKIDQSFVRDIDSDPDDAAIALAVIAMAHSLRLKVIAEGVETAAHLAFLRAHGCDEMQGYYFSRPLPAKELTRLLQQRCSLAPESLGGEKS